MPEELFCCCVARELNFSLTVSYPVITVAENLHFFYSLVFVVIFLILTWKMNGKGGTRERFIMHYITFLNSIN